MTREKDSFGRIGRYQVSMVSAGIRGRGDGHGDFPLPVEYVHTADNNSWALLHTGLRVSRRGHLSPSAQKQQLYDTKNRSCKAVASAGR